MKPTSIKVSRIKVKSKNPDKEAYYFLYAAATVMTVAIFVAPYLAAVVIILAGRSFMLTFHPEFTANNPVARLRGGLIMLCVAAVWLMIIA